MPVLPSTPLTRRKPGRRSGSSGNRLKKVGRGKAEGESELSTMKHVEEYRDPEMAGKLSQRIRGISRKQIRLMEVCGTHTMSIFRYGIRSLLPETISLISGPGCPVCVTSQGEIDACLELCRMEGIIVATFGDLMRVPGTESSLQKERADGKD